MIPSLEHFHFPLADNVHKEVVLHVINAALEAVDPEKAVLNCVTLRNHEIIIGDITHDLNKVKNIFVVGAGKGAAAMTKGVHRLLGDRLTGGLVIVKHLDDSVAPIDNVKFILGDHPVPGTKSVKSSRELVNFLSEVEPDDLVICVITGGGSALMTLPVDTVSLAEIQSLTKQLLSSGARIQEMNVIRKHLDRLKGGGLARQVFPAQMAVLILSDVIGNPLDIIASGPTVADPSTFSDSIAILKKYALWENCPKSIRDHLQSGANGKIAETVKEGDSCLGKVTNLIVGDNLLACQAAKRECEKNGLNSILLTTSLRGEAREAGVFLASILKEMALTGNPIKRPACVIAGGETTVTLHGSGKGGRNQELGLAAVTELAGLEDVVLVALATDGEDGPTDSAGAIVSGDTLRVGVDLGLDPEKFLEQQDSYHYFKRVEHSILIGPTGTNVNDIAFLFSFAPDEG